jgi:hypothetical protein
MRCALAWLRRHRYLDESPAEDRGNEPASATPIDALARLALAGGTFVGRLFPAAERAGDEDLVCLEPRFSATCNGFDVHCAVRVEAGDDARRERFVRFSTRSALRARAHRADEGRPHRVPLEGAASRQDPPGDDASGIPRPPGDPRASS